MLSLLCCVLGFQVYSAKRAAMLRVAESDGLDVKDKWVKKIANQL